MTQPDRKLLSDTGCHRHAWWLLLALTVVLYLPGTGALPLMDRDEPRFAHATVEMMQRGSWAIPYFNGEYRFDKPPLTYWWMALHYAALGVTELAARLHSVIAAYLTALVVCGIGTRLAGARVGLTAGFAWLTTLQVIVHGRLCVADMPMVLCVALACRALMELLDVTESKSPQTNPGFGRWHWVLWLALAFGFLAKGPIAWFVPGLALLLWRFLFWRQPVDWRRLHALRGILLMLAVVGAWGVPALIQTKGAYWAGGIGEHVVKRGTDVFNGRAFIPGFYFVTAFVSLFPWIGFLPDLWRGMRRRWDAPTAFLAAWLAAPYIIFFAYATQLPHYVMPGFPAFAVLVAMHLDGIKTPRWLSLGRVLSLLLIGLGLSAFLGSGQFPEVRSTVSAIGLAVTGLGLFGLVVHGSPGVRHWSPLAAAVCSLLFFHLCHAIRAQSPAEALRSIVESAAPDAELTAWQYTEPSLVFYANRNWKFHSGKLSTVEKNVGRNGPRVVVLLTREWTLNGWIACLLGKKTPGEPDRDFAADADQFAARHPDYERTTVAGLNLARSSWTELLVLARSQ